VNSKAKFVTKSNATRDELEWLRDSQGMKWSEIAQMPKFRGIPQQTLGMIYLGKRSVPKKYRAQLGEPDTQPVPICTKCGVPHWYDCKTHGLKRKKTMKTWTSLSSLSSKEILWLLENRIEV